MFWKSALKTPFHLDMPRVSYPQLHLSRLCLTWHRAKQYRQSRGREIKVYFLIAVTSKYVLKLFFLSYQPAGARIPISQQVRWLTGILLSTREYGCNPSGLAKMLLTSCKNLRKPDLWLQLHCSTQKGVKKSTDWIPEDLTRVEFPLDSGSRICSLGTF